jgi:hypothetical protein
MSKKKTGTVLVLVMTIGLLGAVAYFSMLLNKQGTESVTQVRKTKASAQTYHKLLALNVTPATGVPTSGASSSSSETGGSSSSVSSSSSQSPTPSTRPAPTDEARSYTPISPTIAPTTAPVPTEPLVPTSMPSPTAPLLAYRTITPTLIPPKDTGGAFTVPTATHAPTKAPPTKAPTKAAAPTTIASQGTDTLPETGWVQFSSILFIVAAATVFVSFLF